MKYFEAENLANVLSEMTDKTGIVGYKVARNLRMINDELQEYYQFKQELFKKYGTEEKDGSIRIEKNTENYNAFMKEFEPLTNQEVEFNFRKFTQDELVESGMTAEEMMLLWEMTDDN